MADTRKKPEDLRSHRWFGVDNMRAFGHRSRTMEMGFAREDFAGKPVIAIVNTWSDTNTCHSHMRLRAEEVKRGNLAPDTAVIKPTAAEPHLMQHTGPAVVFSNVDDMYARIDDPNLDVTKDSVLVLQNAGPKGAPGMPEWGQLPIPKKLLEQGVRDMVRISDCRMSGTSYGACVLHVAPEAAVGGPLALVQDGDLITLDVEARILRLEVSDEELARRMAAWVPPEEPYTRGYGRLFLDHITQANKGCDFDFLHAGGPTPEPKIY